MAEEGWGRIHWNFSRVSMPGGASTYRASMPVGGAGGRPFRLPPVPCLPEEEAALPPPDRIFFAERDDVLPMP